MKVKQVLTTDRQTQKPMVQIIQSFSTLLRFLLAALVFCAASASAAQLTWDAGNTNNGATIDSASGA